MDTAGLRESQDLVERIGIERAWTQIAQADAVLFLHDLTQLGDAAYRAADEAPAAPAARARAVGAAGAAAVEQG